MAKTETIHIRVSNDEKEVIGKVASKLHMSISEYLLFLHRTNVMKNGE